MSRKLGAGMEFSQYRPYSQGDDLRRLDWKMYARSDRYYIKESEIDTEVEVTFIADTSRSMQYEESGRSKIQFAKLLTGLLSYFSLLEIDKIGLATPSVQLHGYDERSWKRFLYELEKLKVIDKFQPFEIAKRKSKELFVVITDHYEEANEIQSFVTQLKSKLNEVLILHVLGEKESKLAFNSGDRFEDLETGQVLSFDSSSTSKYQRNLNNWKKDLNDFYLNYGIEYLTVDFTSSFSQIILALNRHRKNLF
jgi:uncharacterized protein (DUF58 family)